MKRNIFFWLLFALVMSLTSCGDDYLNTEDTSYLDKKKADELASSDPSALYGYVNGCFSFMVKYDVTESEDAIHDTFSFMASLHATDMMTEDIAMGSIHWFNYDYEMDNRMESYRRTRAHWLTYYTIVAKANEILSFFTSEPEAVNSKGVMAHGYALRGWAYYYLIQLYQKVTLPDGTLNLTAPGIPMYYAPIDGKTPEEEDACKGRNTVKAVLDQIESDLTKATSLFEAGFKRPSKNYLNYNVAQGLLARYYLLSRQWQKAEQAATLAMSGYSMMDNAGLHDGFMDINNAEWMWGFDHNSETQTTYGSFFSHISNKAPGYAGVGYSPRLIDARLYGKIKDSDYRKSLFNDEEGDKNQESPGAQQPYANLKFGDKGDWTMDYVYMRAAEMVLIRAEALAQQGQNEAAAEALSVLMANRDPKWKEAKVSVDDVWLQRRIELWGEGFSFFDLKRLGKGIDRNYPGTNHFQGYMKKYEAGDPVWTYQLPLAEIQENSHISEADQNE